MNFSNFFKKEQRNRGVEYCRNYSDGLPFTEIYNRASAMNLSAVYAATELISNSVAILPTQVRIKDSKHKETLKNHPLNLIFENKSGSNITMYTMVKLLIQSVILKGNGFAYIYRSADGTPTKLRFLESGQVTINYQQQKDELYYYCSAVSSHKIEPINMIHLIKNSYDGINGISVISYANRTVKSSNAAENSAMKFFANGCNLSGVLNVATNLSEQQKQDIRTSWQSAYGDGGNGIAVLPAQMTYQPISVNAKDAELLETRLFNVQDIARFFNINPVLIGDLSKTSYSAIEDAMIQFLQCTLKPYIEMVEQEFSRKLLKPSENNLYINLDETAILKTNKSATANYYNTLLTSGVLCINEVREELGYSQIENGDKHIIAYTDIEQNTINKENDKLS